MIKSQVYCFLDACCTNYSTTSVAVINICRTRTQFGRRAISTCGPLHMSTHLIALLLVINFAD